MLRDVWVFDTDDGASAWALVACGATPANVWEIQTKLVRAGYKARVTPATSHEFKLRIEG